MPTTVVEVYRKDGSKANNLSVVLHIRNSGSTEPVFTHNGEAAVNHRIERGEAEVSVGGKKISELGWMRIPSRIVVHLKQ